MNSLVLSFLSSLTSLGSGDEGSKGAHGSGGTAKLADHDVETILLVVLDLGLVALAIVASNVFFDVPLEDSSKVFALKFSRKLHGAFDVLTVATKLTHVVREHVLLLSIDELSGLLEVCPDSLSWLSFDLDLRKLEGGGLGC